MPAKKQADAFAKKDRYQILQQCCQGLQRWLKVCSPIAVISFLITAAGCDLNRDNDDYHVADDPKSKAAVALQNNTDEVAHVDPAIESTKEVARYLDVPISAQQIQAIAWQTKVQSPHCQAPSEPSAPLVSETLAPVTSEKNQHGALSPCIEFELNTLDFSPSQPWLTDIMWQTIAHQAVPDKTMSTESGAAKIAVRMMLRQIRGLQTSAINLPIYQYINTEFAINKNQTGYLKIDSVQQRYEHSPKLNYTYYKMVDLSQQKQLALSDVLQPGHTQEELLMLLQQIPKASQSRLVPIDHLPIDLPAQWYMDDLGLHLLYQPGEIIQQTFDERTHKALDTNNLDEIIELVVPYAVINSMLKPQYQVGESINIGINAHTQSGAANEHGRVACAAGA